MVLPARRGSRQRGPQLGDVARRSCRLDLPCREFVLAIVADAAVGAGRAWRATRASNSASSSGGRLRRPPRAGAATVASSPRATGPVSARSGPSAGPVLDRRADERHEQLALEADGGADPLGRRLQRDQEVRGDRGGGVVGGAVRARRSRPGACRARGRDRRRAPGRAGCCRRPRRRRRRKLGALGGDRHQRMQREGLVRRERRPVRWRPSSGRRAGPGAMCAAAAAISASGTHSRTASAPCRRRAPRPSGPSDVVSGVCAGRCARRTSQGGPGRRWPTAYKQGFLRSESRSSSRI